MGHGAERIALMTPICRVIGFVGFVGFVGLLGFVGNFEFWVFNV